jgi:hypothetical protein
MSYLLWPTDWGLPNDPSRPVTFALGRAFVENWNSFLSTVMEAIQLAQESPQRIDEVEAIRRMDIALGFIKNAHELADWVYFNNKPLPFAEAFRHAQRLKEVGYDADWVEATLTGLQKRPVGRPHQRQLFINAFEFQLEAKRNSQGQATRKFCPCGKTHTAKCEQNLKAGMRSLKKVLRKYAPELVSRYEELHPDRARKVNG